MSGDSFETRGAGKVQVFDVGIEEPAEQERLNWLLSRTRPPQETAPFLPDPFPGQYRIVRRLGGGTYGDVWLAEDLRLGKKLVALKTLRPEGDDTLAYAQLAALRHEAGILGQLSHPNIVQVHAWLERPTETGTEHFLVLQYVNGGSLEERLLKSGSLPWEEAGRLVADVAEGLLHAHERGVIHRDIKPANILLANGAHESPGKIAEALLTDFGVAGRLGGPGSRVGTIPYMASEAFARQITPSMDVYSLAVTLFRSVTGAFPFPLPADPRRFDHAAETELLAKIARGLADPDPRFADVPQSLERLIRHGLAADPRHRPDLASFLEELRGALNQSIADTLPPIASTIETAPVKLHLRVSRLEGPDTYRVLATRGARPDPVTRSMKKVPPSPDQVALRTGDRVRVEVLADQTGYVTVFNVGPSGDLNLLFPDEPPTTATPATIWANQPLHVLDVEMHPPAGRERLFAIWSRRPLSLSLEQIHGAVTKGEVSLSGAYQATRNMVKVKQSVAQLPPGEWQAVVVELDHAT